MSEEEQQRLLNWVNHWLEMTEASEEFDDAVWVAEMEDIYSVFEELVDTYYKGERSF